MAEKVFSIEAKPAFFYELSHLLKEYHPMAKVRLSEPASDQASTPPCESFVFTCDEAKREVLLRHLAEDGSELFCSSMSLSQPEGERTEKDICKLLLLQSQKRALSWGILTGVRPSKLAFQRLVEGAGLEETAVFLQKYYLLSPQKADLTARVAQKELSLVGGYGEEDISLYLHIPYCPTRCAYCSFITHDRKSFEKEGEVYLQGLLAEIQGCKEAARGRRLRSLYLGGGTPSILNIDQLNRLFQAIDETYSLASFQEITLEGGRPDTLSPEKLRALSALGVTRLSINPQSMNQKTLDLIGRKHQVSDIVLAFENARSAGFDNINMDIILGLPGEGAEEVKSTLSQIAALKPEALTVHTLSVKRSSSLYESGEGKALLEHYQREEGEKELEDLLLLAAESAKSQSMEPYYMYRQKNMAGNFENVGYALPGKECRYNIEIMEERQSILAFGAGAVSKRFYAKENRLERFGNPRDIDTYLKQLSGLTEEKVHEFRLVD